MHHLLLLPSIIRRRTRAQTLDSTSNCSQSSPPARALPSTQLPRSVLDFRRPSTVGPRPERPRTILSQGRNTTQLRTLKPYTIAAKILHSILTTVATATTSSCIHQIAQKTFLPRRLVHRRASPQLQFHRPISRPEMLDSLSVSRLAAALGPTRLSIQSRIPHSA